MSALPFDDERAARAREVLATARRNLIGHTPRDVRVAAVIAEARATVRRLDPKRQEHEALAEMRRQRFKRAKDAALVTLQRTAYVSAPARGLVYKRIENARVTSTEPISPTPRKQTKQLPRSSDGIDDLQQRFWILREAIPEVVANLQDEFRRGDDLLRYPSGVGRRRPIRRCHRA